MAYDHMKNAGNQGDVIKHVALVAVLDTILQPGGKWQDEFVFADLYAGYASSVLSPATKGRGEWIDGIGMLAGRVPSNLHVKAWKASYVGEEVLEGDSYPGSIMIARDLILRHEYRPRLRAWDIQPAPLGNLWTLLGSGDERTKTGVTVPCQIRCVPAMVGDPAVQQAGFLFLDPPEVTPHAAGCLKLLRGVPKKDFLLWLPIGVDASKGKNPPWGGANITAHEDAMQAGYSATIVVWAKGGRTMGCELIYPFLSQSAEARALRDAVDDVVRLLQWSVVKTFPLTPPAAPLIVKASVWHSP